ncbi:hypothetical protein F4803DRAFT_540103, partial [Xylaria telfairii]
MIGSREKDHNLTMAPSPLRTFYLLGWDLSRSGHPEELSESISISTLGFQTKLETIRMYTHPDAFSRHPAVTRSLEDVAQCTSHRMSSQQESLLEL